MKTKVFLLSVLVGTLIGPGTVKSQEPIQVPGQAVIEEAQGSYIFVFDPDQVQPEEIPGLARGLAQQHGAGLRLTFTHAIQGFSANISAEGAAQLAENNPLIQYYEPNGVVWAIGRPAINPNKKPTNSPGNGPGKGSGDATTSEPPQVVPYGISRVGGPVDGSIFNAWVIDTGIDLDHPDLNIGAGANFILTGKNSPDDGNGHGTHVAGTIAAIDNSIDVVGVAAGTVVHPVRVLNNSGSGTIDGVVAGVDWVAANASPGDCANMSLGGSGHWQSLHDAVLNAADAGIRFAIAAGNSGNDAELHEPAHVNHANVYTVSAINSSDVFASFSNWGNPPIDFAAPGVSVLSTKKGGGVTTYSGTSMAAPHACGVLTLVNTPGQDGNAIGDPDGNPDPIIHK
ncbi:MAG TPA: S8 family serine peptidase [Desulfobacteria bacterium]|nr:S8 family serine peptidase [Desulfobacteria bacterium]